MTTPRDLTRNQQPIKSPAGTPPRLEAIDKSSARTQTTSVFPREQAESSATMPPAKAFTRPSSARLTPARAPPVAPGLQPATVQPAVTPALAKAPESTTQRLPQTPRTRRTHPHSPSTSPHLSALVQQPPKPCKTHPTHPISSWLRPSPTKLSMARQTTNGNARELGTEFEGHEEAATARVKRRQEARNEERWRLANAADAGTTGESRECIDNRRKGKSKSATATYLNGDARSFFPDPAVGPDDSFKTPSWFIEALRKLTKHTTVTPKESPIQFATTRSAAEHNERTLALYEFDLDRLIEKFANTTLGYGSEFRTVEELKPLIGPHPNFPALAQVLTNGMSYVFTRELDPVTKLAELKTLMARGNHKSAKEFPDQVKKLLDKDVLHGFTIPIPTQTVWKIPGAAIQPLGLASQWTLNEDGERVAKFRMTQDLSFSSNQTGKSVSINSRIDMSAYSEMIYGWCFPRIVQYTLALRFHHPGFRILICKYDYSDAYRRIAHSAGAAAQTISIHDELAYLSLRLTFGGSPNPPTWCLFSEIVTDLANEISQCAEWDPAELHSPAQPQTPDPKRLAEDVPLAKSKRMAVAIPIPTNGAIGRVDGFIDDLINVFLDTPHNCRIQPHAVPLAMHVTSRPHAGDDVEPIVRRPILSIPKLLAEGSPAEVQNVLGWRVDTRRLLIALPDDKYDAWVGDLTAIETAGRCSFKELDRIVGRLNHSSYVVPVTRNFLGRLRSLLSPRRRDDYVVKLGKEDLADVALWKTILARANQGISMNLIAAREPDRVCWSDACPLGIGGYNLSGRAWRIQIPPTSIVRGHQGVNNLLEFVGMVVNVWLECLDKATDQACILAVGDNTSAIGWLFRTASLDRNGQAHEAHLFVARTLATLLLDHGCCIASQHIKGDLNVVADLRSFAGTGERGKAHPLAFDDPPDDILTQRFHSNLASQVPENFKISPLPNEILCWITHVLQIAASSLEAARKDDTRTPTESGDGGSGLAGKRVTVLTPSSLCYPTTNASCSRSRSSSAIEPLAGPPEGTLQESVRSRWSQALCGKPQATWLRRFGAISGQAPCTSREATTYDPSCDHY